MNDWGDIYGVDREERAERLRNGIIPLTVLNGPMTVRLRIANPEIPQDFPTLKQIERFGMGNIPDPLKFPITERDVFHKTNQTRYIETIMYANRESEHLFIRSQRYGEPNFSAFQNKKYYVITLNNTLRNIITFGQAYDTIACTCDDFYYRSGAFEDFKCKHMLAIEYALENSQEYIDIEETEKWQNDEAEEEEEVVEEPEAPVLRRSRRIQEKLEKNGFGPSNSKMNDTDEDFLVNVFKLLKIKRNNNN